MCALLLIFCLMLLGLVAGLAGVSCGGCCCSVCACLLLLVFCLFIVGLFY